MRLNLRTLPVLFLLLMLAAPATAFADRGGRITGKVKDPDGAGLLGAIVTIFRTDSEGGTISFTRSDRSGSYSFSNITPGSYYLQVSRHGYQPITKAGVQINEGKVTNLDVILQDFFDMISAEPDPRNWDLRTVMRSTSDRRLIFRDLPGTDVANQGETGGEAFQRGGTMHIASSAGLSSENYSVFPSSGHNGIISNFAFTEPLSEHGRMIVTGQLNSGYDSMWRVRNTLNYRHPHGRDVKFSVAYGRLNLNGPGPTSLSRPAQFFALSSNPQETGVQTLGMELAARDTFLDVFEVEYGVDLSRVSYGTTRNFVSPHFQVAFVPADNWLIRASRTSRRFSDNSMVALPDGEIINLVEPIYIAKIGGEVNVSEFNHSEVSLARDVGDDTSIEVALYEDHMQGPGTPFLVSARGRAGSRARVAQLREDQSAHNGVRVVVHQRFLDIVNGSIAYVYGSAAQVSGADSSLSSELLARNLLDYVQRSYYHSLTGQIHTRFDLTKTELTTILRWNPGHPLTPIDLFSDRFDTLTKGLSFSVRQAIPLPEFMGAMARWEALVDVRNLLDQGRNRILTRDGEIVLTRNPRSLRFGLNLNFY